MTKVSSKLFMKIFMLVTLFVVTANFSFAKNSLKKNSIAVISLQQAQDIALTHSGVDKAEARFTKAKQSSTKYDLEFITTNSNRYEYEISSIDGSILDFDWDIKTLLVSITLEEAKLIALTHANEDYEDVVFRKAKLDDGIYELDFITKLGNKYEYAISSVDGRILDYECDVKFSTSIQNFTTVSDATLSTRITEAEAKRIAMNDAGVTLADLDFIVSYISWSKHSPSTYEVKFETRNNRKPYVYTIDLYTGKILNIRIAN